MGAVAEGDVVVGVAGDVEIFGAGEVFGIAVGGADEREDELAGEEGLAVHFDLAGGGAHHPLQGGAVAEDFFDGGFEEIHVGTQ